MNKLLMTALAVSLFASAGVASAGNGNGNGHGKAHASNHQERDSHRQAKWERKAQKRYAAGRYRVPPGYYVRQWAHGDHLPATYRTRTYVVDYRQYGLPAPPRGYQYVRVGDDAVLSGANSGVVDTVIRMLFQ